MNSTIQAIRAAIVVVDGKVVVTPPTLDSDAVTALLAAYFAGQTLTIESAKITSQATDDFVTVAGSVELFGVAVTGAAKFYVDGEAQVEFQGAPPSGWRLGDSFAVLVDDYFNQFALAGPQLTLVSKGSDGVPNGASLDAGFSLPAILEPLRWFVDPGAAARISGPISLTAGQPVMSLSVSPALDVQIGGYLGVTLQMQHIAKAFPKPRDPSGVVILTFSRLAGDIAFGDPPAQVEVPLAVVFSSDLTVLELRLDTEQVFSLGFSQISHWFNGFDVVGQLPTSLSTAVGLTMHDVEFAIGLVSKALERVCVELQSTKPWVVLTDKIVIETVTMDLCVRGLPNAPKLQATIRGVLDVGATLDIYAQVPDFVIKGSLAEGSTNDLGPLLTHFGAPQDDLPIDLKIDTLSFAADHGGDSYELAVRIDGDWAIIDGLELDELAMTVSYRASTLSASFEAGFAIAGVDIEVSAVHDGDAGGWQFFGATAPDSEIRLGELITELTAKFSSTAAQQLPEVLTSLVITRLAVSFDTATKEFRFDCTLDFSIGETTLQLRVLVDLQRDGTSYKQLYSGVLLIGDLRFALEFEKTGGGEAQPATFFVAAVEPNVKVGLRELVGHVDAAAGELMPDLSVDIEELLFVYEKQGTSGASYLFGAALGFNVDLSSLPLVGKLFNGDPTTGLKDVQLLFASKPITQASVSAYNTLLADAEIKPRLPTATASDPSKPVAPTTVVLEQGFNLAATLELAGKGTQVGAGGATALVAPSSATPPPAPTPPAGDASWFNVNKAVGPVTIRRVGVRYQDSHIWLLLDADFQLALLSFGLQGLGLGFDPQDPASIRADLAGMSLAYQSGPLEIAGGFLNFSGDYLGEALVEAGEFGLTAIGGLAPKDNSFFVFVRLDAPLGGPPFFFITGLAGGFGINRSLDLPTIDQLPSFALLPQNNSFPKTLDPNNPGGTLAATLAATESYIHPMAGQYWLAAGIDFTSFEMVDASVLLAVSFGVELEVALLGICRITIPKEDPDPVVFLEIALEAQFEPSKGLIAIDGRITPASFLFAGLVRITGGFAFYTWYSGEHAGDFVVTIGGYHPHFVKPDNYPVVPRLELSYNEGPLVMKGDAYLALVPHMVMGGLDIRITWAEGPVSAWLDAGLDFLLGWRPFHYEASAHINVGASLSIKLLFVRIHITVHVGAELTIWGPPFGGKARVDLDIFSFTIHFGASPRTELVSWDEFKSSFLPAAKHEAAAADALLAAPALTASDPADAHLCTASVTDGLRATPKAKQESEFFSWLLDPNHFVIASTTLIPAKTGQFNDFALQNPFSANSAFHYQGAGTPTATPSPALDASAGPDGVSWPTDFGVLPVGLASAAFETGHTVALTRLVEGEDYTDPSKYTDKIDNVRVGPNLTNSQQALWAASDPGLNGARLIPGTLVGLGISPMIQHPEITLRADLWSMLFDQNQVVQWRASAPDVPSSDSFAGQVVGDQLMLTRAGEHVHLTDYELGDALTASTVAAARGALIDSLSSLGLELDKDQIDVTHLADYPLWDWPIIEALGEGRAAS